MNLANDALSLPGMPCDDASADALSLYLDGELPFEAQPMLFHHLAQCASCRQLLGATLEFRRMSRQENLVVTSAMDVAFFKRLDKVKRQTQQIDRASDRRPLWQAKGSVSLLGVTTLSVVLFCAGLLVPVNTGESVSPLRVTGIQEEIDLPPEPIVETLYVFYPGVTIEASKMEEGGH